MTGYPTDLDPAEERLARQRLTALADRFTEGGELRSPEWREAFLSTWRHPYVPAYYPAVDRPPVLCVDPDQRASWLEAVYSDETLLTKVQPTPLSRAFRPATASMYTSSSTLPSLVVRMLEDLDVQDGHRVLEIGTGSGYNCALLCQRLGGEHVTSIDIDPELTDLAGERLAANGHTPTLATLDGAEGYPRGAPYDRIIATCAVGAIPAAWLRQAAPGAVIITDVHGLLGGTLVRLSVDAEGTATGRFVPYWTGFMQMRRAVEPETLDRRQWSYDEEPTRSTTDLDPAPLRLHGLFGFVLQWLLPGVSRGLGATEDDQPAVRVFDADGSEAVIEIGQTNGRHRVIETGPRRLWRAVEDVHEFWQSAGQPSYDRFGITATAAEQYVWLDDPDGPHRWPLPNRSPEPHHTPAR